MNADHALVTGYSHHVCQDYIRTVTNGLGQSTVMLADGCSGSPDTDTGARLLVLAACALFQQSPTMFDTETDAFFTVAARRAVNDASGLKLPRECCDATLVVASAAADSFRVAAYGDGVIVGRHREAGLVVHELVYESDVPGQSWPNYPIYQEQPDRLAALLAKEKEINLHKVVRTNILGPDDVWTEIVVPAKLGVSEVGGYIDSWKWIAILSDGAGTFKRPVGDLGQYEPVPTRDVIRRLCDFKNMKGQFVQRRLNRFLRDIERDGWKHEDDVSFGVINFDA